MRLADIARLLQHPTLRGTVAVQGLGSVATLALGLLIALIQGPEAQGHYGVVRATADLLLAICLLGLPQSLIHLVQHQCVRPASLETALRRYMLVLASLAAVMIVVQHLGWGSTWLPVELQGHAVTLAVAIAVLGWVAQNLQRSFVLCLGSTQAFSWLTAAPALTLLACGLVVMAIGSQRYEWALAASGVLSAVWGAWALRPLQSARRWQEGGTVKARAVIHAGGHSAIQAVMVTAQPYLALWFMQRWDASATEIGWLVLAAYVHQAFILPATFALPLLYAHASKARGTGGEANLWRSVWAIGILACVAAVLLVLALPPLLPAIADGAYTGSLDACLWLAWAGPAAVVGRLAAVMLLGQGRFALVSAIFSLRTGAMAILLPTCLWLGAGGIATAAAAGWALAEACAAACLLTASYVRRPRK